VCSSIYRLCKEDKTGEFIKCRGVGTGNPHHPVPPPRLKDNHPFLLNPAMPGRTALCPNVFSTGSGPKPSSINPPEFWWWDHYSGPTHMSTYFAVAYLSGAFK
jgi:hypothetical protein